MSITIMDAILAINPDAQVSIKHDAENHVYDEITWHDGTTPISDIDIGVVPSNHVIWFTSSALTENFALGFIFNICLPILMTLQPHKELLMTYKLMYQYHHLYFFHQSLQYK